MTARVLVVDDVPANVKLLEARLSAEYFDVATAMCGADALAIATEWNEFRRPDFTRMRKVMRAPVIFDGRNLFTPDEMKANGFKYYSVGRASRCSLCS